MDIVITPFLIVGIFCYFLIKADFGRDKIIGAQKVHSRDVSRLGGVAIFGGVILTSFIYSEKFISSSIIWALLICSLFVFVVGVFEDFTHKITPIIRLFFAAASVPMMFKFNNYITKTDILLIDRLLEYRWLAYALTLFVGVGFINAVNIMDGFNGLASGLLIQMLLAVLWLSIEVNDVDLVIISLIFISSIFGFFAMNWPAGKIFLGDGGAYFIGFSFLYLSLSLLNRNSLTISPMCIVLISIIPLIEAVYSMFRRVKKRLNVYQPDSLHLHSLLYKKINMLGRRNNNYKVFLYYALLQVAILIYSIKNYSNTDNLLSGVVFIIAGYVATYNYLLFSTKKK